jgi:hypothetical protein
MFAVGDIEDVLARLHTRGAELVGELEQYEDSYRLCYVRGPEGIIVALAGSSAEGCRRGRSPNRSKPAARQRAWTLEDIKA